MRLLPALLALPLAASLATSAIAAQDRSSTTARGGTSRQVQPKIMVIPFTKEDEDIRRILEADFNRRIAITKVKEGFDNRGFSTIDFLGVVRAMGDDQGMQITSQSDVKSRIIEQSRCDIYVVVEAQRSTAGGEGVSMILTSYLAANGISLANKIASAGPYTNVPYERIVERAAADKIEPFLATMQEKFDEFVENGVPIRVEFSVRQGAAKNLSSPVGATKDELSVLLEDWFEKNAYKNNYHVSGTGELRMTVDEVRIPMFDPRTNNNYNPNRFALELMRFLQSLDVRASRSITGGTIYVELQ